MNIKKGIFVLTQKQEMEKLFVYGTLRDKSIRKKITGKAIPSLGVFKLDGYKLSGIVIGGTEYPIIFNDPNSNELIEGELIEVSESELSLLDEYEGSEYSRTRIELQNGHVVWAYTL
jgi:gamma-glutamylcyclotransferase (GGCT)/AIG2-like uncharacterized protein YtfP